MLTCVVSQTCSSMYNVDTCKEGVVSWKSEIIVSALFLHFGFYQFKWLTGRLEV